MGLIKRGLLVVVGVLLLLTFFATGVFYTISSSLEYDVVKPELKNVVQEVLNERGFVKEINENLDIINLYCENNSEYVFSMENFEEDLVIPCSVVAGGLNTVVDYGVTDFVDNVYYGEYNCNFLDCISKGEPYALVSQKSKDYFNSKFYLALIISLIFLCLMFFLVENKSNFFILSGLILIVSSLPLMKLKEVFGFFTEKIFLSVLTVYFTSAYLVFLKFIIFGLIFLSIGIILKFFGAGFKIADFFSKFRKNPQKEVVVKK